MKNLKWVEAQREIKKGNVFLEFYTDWCGDCKMMNPVIDNLENYAKENNINIKFIKVNAEEANFFRDEKAEFKVLKVPSFFVLENGKSKHIGYEYLPMEILKSSIDKFQ